jgi:hypothetical protein
MPLQLTNQQRIQIEAAAATLLPGMRQSFIAGVLKALERGPQQPPTMNNVLMAVQVALSAIPASSVIISRSTGKSTNDADHRRRRYF